MRFCQVDGTPLVEEPSFDPYATVVGVQAPTGSDEAASAPSPGPSSTAINVPDNLLEVPEADPLKTVAVSESEMKEVLAGVGAPPAEPEPPAFIAPDVAPPASAGDAPPPSPFSAPGGSDEGPVPAPAFDAPAAEPQEAQTLIQPQGAPEPFEPPAPSPFQPQAAAPVEQWTPPPAPDASWQNQEIGQNTPFQPPPAGAGGQSQGLAIASMVSGIASLVCCTWFVVGIAAIVMGFIARNKAINDPANYGGAGMAMAGIITGGLSIVLGIIVLILYLGGILASGGFNF